jgi:uncharacterized protein
MVINIAKKLNELQIMDLEIQRLQVVINMVDQQIQGNQEVLSAREKLQNAKADLLIIEKNRHSTEWEVDEAEKSIKQIEQKIYSGAVKNPKELMGFQQELKVLKDKLKEKEEELFKLMSEEEQLQLLVKTNTDSLLKIEQEYNSELPNLKLQKSSADESLMKLREKRETIVSEVDSQTMKLYETLKQRKGQAVVKVEQGRCQGCRISLSVNELQKAKAGNLIQCSSCGLILYLS